MHVARLREKLRDDPADPAVLLTVRGKGYMFRAMQAAQNGHAAEAPKSKHQKSSKLHAQMK
jgi:DNA-binding winged helix-turn-helix (wHTH) protein